MFGWRVLFLLVAIVGLSSLLSPAAEAQPRVRAIEVMGNQRIEADTIRSYMLVQPGDVAEPERLDRSLRALFATGLFRDITIWSEGDRVMVRVVENPVINRIAFEGNRRITSEQLQAEILLAPRAVFTPAAAAADRQRIRDLYARRGRLAARVEPKIIELEHNRVDVVFEIEEGDVALVSRIDFIGNTAFSDSRLREVIATRERAWYRLLATTDIYDPERLAFDRELLRRHYLRHGYADVEVTTAVAELTPDRSGFLVTFTIVEGPRYRIGKIDIRSMLRGLDPESLRREIPIAVGDWYDGEAVERADNQLTDALVARGFVFANVEPRVVRHAETATVDLTFEIGEGPRAFIERIEISGNTRTQDRVIRREFRLAEGDPLIPQLVRRSRDRIRNLGYFSDVQLTTAPGSAPDLVILNTQVRERATGEFTIGGGYSTEIGFLADVGLRERNLLGTGIDGRFNVTLAQRRSQFDIAVTDPQFLERNLAVGLDLFVIQRDLRETSGYQERRRGVAVRAGYEINERLRQSWSYALVDRNVYDISPFASRFIAEQRGRTLLSQVSSTITYDRRDSRIEPRDGYVVRLGLDWAGPGGEVYYLRFRTDAQYYIPFERLFGDPDFVLVLAAGAGYLMSYGGRDSRIVDRFFLGGENLRGFALGGAGPRDISTRDSLGGERIWTASAEFRFPLPVPSELGLLGRAFVDSGALWGLPTSVNAAGCPTAFPNCLRRDGDPRVGAGIGISWRSPIGLINLDFAQAVVKKAYDETQVFRLGFGTRF